MAGEAYGHMNDVDHSDGAFLLTHWGTIIYWDEATEALRHGPIADVPLNLLGFQRGEYLEIRTADQAVGSWLIQRFPDQHVVSFEIRSWFKTAVRFIAAQEDGRTAKHRERAADMGQFMLLSRRTAMALKEFVSNDWVSFDGYRERLSSRPAVRMKQGFTIEIDGDLVEVTPNLDHFVIEQETSQDRIIVRRINYIRQNGTIGTLARFRPALYWCAFGKESIFDCLALSINSAVDFGEFTGDFIIITDRDEEYIRRLVPKIPTKRIFVKKMKADSPKDYTFARYFIADLGIEEYQPICYMDYDVIVNKSILPLLAKISCSRKFWIGTEMDHKPHLQGENMLTAHGDWYGQWLFRGESNGEVGANVDTFYSSGVFAFCNVSAVRLLFGAMRVWHEYYEKIGGKNFDQPFLNYALHRLGVIDISNLDPYYSNGGKKNWDRAERRGFLHFQGGVGRAGGKIQAMQQYYDLISSQAQPQSSAGEQMLISGHPIDGT
jgi:hypothetical protein